MWEKIGDFSLDYIGFCFSFVGSRQIAYKNLSSGSKISEISLSRGDEESDLFRMFITASTPAEFENLKKAFTDAKLIFGTFKITELYFDVSDYKSFIPFLKAIQTFEPSLSELEAELTRKYNRDYTDYPLGEAPPALVEASSSLKHPRDEVDESLFEPNKSIGYADQGTKRPLEGVRKNECLSSRVKVG